MSARRLQSRKRRKIWSRILEKESVGLATKAKVSVSLFMELKFSKNILDMLDVVQFFHFIFALMLFKFKYFLLFVLVTSSGHSIQKNGAKNSRKAKSTPKNGVKNPGKGKRGSRDKGKSLGKVDF